MAYYHRTTCNSFDVIGFIHLISSKILNKRSTRNWHIISKERGLRLKNVQHHAFFGTKFVKIRYVGKGGQRSKGIGL